jgi:hypothetical protein
MEMRFQIEGASEWLNELQTAADDYVQGRVDTCLSGRTSCGICKENMPNCRN